ncbi:hypothetical protein ACO0QE_003823 [Hanseniaspora vineae]
MFSASEVPTPCPPTFNNANEDDIEIAPLEAENYISKHYPDLNERINSIVDSVITKFVFSWFEKIDENRDSDFIKQVRFTLTECVDNVVIQLENKADNENELVSKVLSKILHLIQKHFSAYILASSTANTQSANKEVQLAMLFHKQFKLHKAVTLTSSNFEFDREVQNYLRETVEKIILPLIMSKDELQLSVSTILIREILVCTFFKTLLDKFSNPDYLNTKIIELSDNLMEEQQQIRSLRKILSAKVSKGNLITKNKTSGLENNKYLTLEIDSIISQSGNNEQELISYGQRMVNELNINCSGKQFERLLKQITALNHPTMLKYLRNLIILKLMDYSSTSELKKQYSKKSISTFRERLELLLDLIEKKVPSDYDSAVFKFSEENLHVQSNVLRRNYESRLASLSLANILNNARHSQLFECFASYNNPELSPLIRFWNSVEEIKSPLENSEVQVDVVCDVLNTEQKDAIRNMCIKYLIQVKSWFENNPDYELLEEYSNMTTNISYGAARQALLLLQEEALRYLQTSVYPMFLHSKEACYLLSKLEESTTQTESHLSQDEIPTNMTEKRENEIESGFQKRNKFGEEQNESSNSLYYSSDISEALDNILNEKANKSLNNDYLFGNRAEGIFKQDSLFSDEEDDDEAQAALKVSTAVLLAEQKNLSVSNHEPATVGTSACSPLSIESLTMSIHELDKQLSLLRHLILKAELTNNQKELRLLKKSERTVLRELDQKKSLKKEFSLNELFLFNNTDVSISNYIVKDDVSYYNVNVIYLAHTSEMQAWSELKRFSEFVRLNSYMRKTHEKTRALKFPGKLELAFNKITMLQERKIKLEKYLNHLISIPQVCQDPYFIKFLTTSSYSNGGFYKSDSSSLRSDSSEYYDTESKKSAIQPSKNVTSFSDMANQSIFVKPMCDIFSSMFQLEQGTSVRGKTILVVLQQLLGGTVEKYIKDMIKRTTSKEKLLELLASVDNLLKHNSVLDGSLLHENVAEQNSKMEPHSGSGIKQKQDKDHLLNIPDDESSETLSRKSLLSLETLMAYQCSKAVGVKRSKRAAFLIHEMLQNKYMNYSLMLYILDIVMQEVFM